MIQRKLAAPILLGMAAALVSTMASGPLMMRVRAQSTDEASRVKQNQKDQKQDDKDAEALQGSWQGHPSATICTGIFAPVPFSPTSPVCPYSFYTMTTFIP